MIFITGGAGYIGSHTALTLLQAGQDVLVLDSLINSSALVLKRIAAIAGKEAQFIQGDIRNAALLQRIFKDYPIEAIIHFAGLKAVGESVAKPLLYHQVNVGGTLTLLEAAQTADINTFIFSSSATVYGDAEKMPVSETTPTAPPTNPYGRSKLIIEKMLSDCHQAGFPQNIALLRYFNPIGAHESGLIGEAPDGIPNNLVPYIAQVAVGKREKLQVFGADYPTPDGTGLRDYLHVMDLAEGHVRALEFLRKNNGLYIWNLGTGQPYSVLDIHRAFERACGKRLPYEIVPRRAGDIAVCYADVSKAARELGWKATRNLETMMADAWRWQAQNPNGYE